VPFLNHQCWLAAQRVPRQAHCQLCFVYALRRLLYCLLKRSSVAYCYWCCIYCRWDKPEAHVQDAVESRMRDMDLATQRSLRVSVDHRDVPCCNWCIVSMCLRPDSCVVWSLGYLYAAEVTLFMLSVAVRPLLIRLCGRTCVGATGRNGPGETEGARQPTSQGGENGELYDTLV
jgi:hypothetical protein